MAREITIKYNTGKEVHLTIGKLYSVHNWNKNAFFRLISINEEKKTAKLATVKSGKIYEVWVYELVPYIPPKKPKLFYWKHPGY